MWIPQPSETRRPSWAFSRSLWKPGSWTWVTSALIVCPNHGLAFSSYRAAIQGTRKVGHIPQVLHSWRVSNRKTCLGSQLMRPNVSPCVDTSNEKMACPLCIVSMRSERRHHHILVSVFQKGHCGGEKRKIGNGSGKSYKYGLRSGNPAMSISS